MKKIQIILLTMVIMFTLVACKEQLKEGDIVLYSRDKIVVFYGSNTWDYTRLGIGCRGVRYA